jgi:hypothetical protein
VLGASACLLTPSPVLRALLNVRLFVGRLLGWDREPAATTWESFATRMTTADRSRSLVPAGTREGLFRVVYRFENEQLLELIDRTAPAAALSALVETGNGYRFYFGVYVRSVSRFTPIYMALIDPFRKLVACRGENITRLRIWSAKRCLLNQLHSSINSVAVPHPQ